MAFEIKHALTMTAPDDPAFENNPSDWNAALVVAGADVGGIPYCPTATTIATSANFTYADTLINSGPGLKVGTATTSAGLQIGYYGVTGYGGIWPSTVTPSTTNYTLYASSTDTQLQGSSTLQLATNNSVRMQFIPTAGSGPSITAGTATTDVNSLSTTMGMNAAAVAFTGWKGTFTEGASGTAAGTKLINLLYGTSGAETTQFAVSKTGLITTGGTDGVTAGPFTVITGIQTKNGIVTVLTGS